MKTAVAVGGKSGRRGGGRVRGRETEKLREGVEEREDEEEKMMEEEEETTAGRGVVRRAGGRGAFVEKSNVELVDVDIVVASVVASVHSSSSSKRLGPNVVVLSSSRPKTCLMQLSIIGG